jgi:hypothetical protein
MNLRTLTGFGYATICWEGFLFVEAILHSQTTKHQIKIDVDNMDDFADKIVSLRDQSFTLQRDPADKGSKFREIRLVHRGPLVDIIWDGDPINKICTFNTAELILQIAPEMLRYLKTS